MKEDQNIVNYNAMLLEEAGLIKAAVSKTNMGLRVIPQRLTWYGHEFLDEARNDMTWNAAKEKVTAAAGSLSVELLKMALSELGKQALKSLMG